MLNVYQFITEAPIMVQSNWSGCITMAGYNYGEYVQLHDDHTVAITKFNWFKTIQKLPGNTIIHHAIRAAENSTEVSQFIWAQYLDNPEMIREIIPSFILNQIL